MGSYASGAALLPVAPHRFPWRRIVSRGPVITTLRAPNRMLSSCSSTCRPVAVPVVLCRTQAALMKQSACLPIHIRLAQPCAHEHRNGPRLTCRHGYGQELLHRHRQAPGLRLEYGFRLGYGLRLEYGLSLKYGQRREPGYEHEPGHEHTPGYGL